MRKKKVGEKERKQKRRKKERRENELSPSTIHCAYGSVHKVGHLFNVVSHYLSLMPHNSIKSLVRIFFCGHITSSEIHKNLSITNMLFHSAFKKKSMKNQSCGCNWTLCPRYIHNRSFWDIMAQF